MANKYILDTHTLIWYLEGNEKLGARAKSCIDTPENHLVLPMIALAEAMFIVERGKSVIPDVASLLSDVDREPRLLLFPLNRAVLDKTMVLQDIPEMHDRQIVATALVLSDQGHTSFLLTRDRFLIASNAIATIW